MNLKALDRLLSSFFVFMEMWFITPRNHASCFQRNTRVHDFVKRPWVRSPAWAVRIFRSSTFVEETKSLLSKDFCFANLIFKAYNILLNLGPNRVMEAIIPAVYHHENSAFRRKPSVFSKHSWKSNVLWVKVGFIHVYSWALGCSKMGQDNPGLVRNLNSDM